LHVVYRGRIIAQNLGKMGFNPSFHTPTPLTRNIANTFFLEISYPIFPVCILQWFSILFSNRSWVSLYFYVLFYIFVYFIVISRLYFCLHVILKIIWISGIGADCSLSFLIAGPRRDHGINIWVLSYFFLRTTTLAIPSNLPWRKKREMIEKEILSIRCSRKRSCNKGMR
jgi:hypothetical protein